MFNPTRARGFSLVEILLVLAIIGILSSIAIPSYLGQRRRSRVIGDAMSNVRVLQMGLETRKADIGIYGAAGAYDWKADGTATSGPTLIPSFQPKGASLMDYKVEIANGGISYVLTAYYLPMGPSAVAYQTDQNGRELARLH